MPLPPIKFALSRKHPEPRMFTRHERLKPSYDVVIIGAGGHGCAAAYYLARDHGISAVAILEQGYLGGGNTGRNTTIIRSNYLTPEGVQFYDESVRLWQDLSQDFDLNLFYSTRGHFTLAHTDAAMRTMRWRAEVNRHFGVASEAIDSQAVRKATPMRDLPCGGDAPVVGALYHAPGAIARHDAVAWGYARGADRRGVEIHQNTQVLAIELEDHGSGRRVAGVVTNRGRIATRKVLCAVAGYTPRLLAMVGLRSPIYVHPLQAMVSEPLKPWLDPIIVSGSLHVYVSQSARRARHGGIARPLRAAFHAFHARLRGISRGTHARAVSLPCGRQDQSAMGRDGRHDARLHADHGIDAGAWLLPRLGVGYLGVQGDPGVRQDYEPHGGDGCRPSADRGFRVRSLRALRPDGGEGRGLGRALIGEALT